MSLSYLLLNDLLSDMQRENASEQELRAAFVHVFKQMAVVAGTTKEEREQQDNQRVHQKILTTVANHPRWNPHNSMSDVVEFIAGARKDSDGLINEHSRLAVVDALRRVPAGELMSVIDAHKNVWAEQNLLGLPFVVSAQLKDKLQQQVDGPTGVAVKKM